MILTERIIGYRSLARRTLADYLTFHGKNMMADERYGPALYLTLEWGFKRVAYIRIGCYGNLPSFRSWLFLSQIRRSEDCYMSAVRLLGVHFEVGFWTK